MLSYSKKRKKIVGNIFCLSFSYENSLYKMLDIGKNLINNSNIQKLNLRGQE